MNKEKALNVALIGIYHCRRNQIYSSVQESDFMIVRLVFVTLLSCLHALEREHNELIDDMTRFTLERWPSSWLKWPPVSSQ